MLWRRLILSSFVRPKNVFDPDRIEKNMPKGEHQVADAEKAVAVEVEERA